MPIKSLTVEQDAIAFPRLGVLRKGGEKRERQNNGRTYEIFGEDLDHFRFDTEDQAALVEFTRIFGEQPRQVRVVLPFPTMAQNFQVWQEAYTAGSLLHRCDGETCVRWLDTASGKYRNDPVPCPSLKLPENDKNRCKPVGRLMVMLPDLRRLAHVVVLTHSLNDILELQRNMLALEVWRGDLRGIIWSLTRQPREISTPREGKRVRTEKWLLFMEPMAEYANSLLQASTQAALGGGAIAALPDGGNANTVTGEIFDADAVVEEAPPVVEIEVPYDINVHINQLGELRDRWKALGGEFPKLKGADVKTREQIDALIEQAQAGIAAIEAVNGPGASYEPVEAEAVAS